MNSKQCIQKALTMCLLMTVIATFSMVALAGPVSVAGELTVTGGNSADTTFVTVNGEPAKSGRTISSSSTITTPEGMTAIVNFGKLGKIEFGPSTTFALNADNNALSGELTSGSITVLSAANGVSVKTISGEVVHVAAGESATAANGTATKQAPKKATGNEWAVWGIVFGVAAVAIIWAATTSNDTNIGGASTTTSPIR